jgi:D-alanyl-D-alanine carboxypeptidase
MKSIFTLITFILVNVLYAQTHFKIESGKIVNNAKFDSLLADQLQDALDNERNVQNVKGVSAAVIIPDQGTWTGASGISHSNVNISSDMLFGLASVTKNYTAAIILKLAEQGILSLDDSLHSWLPTFNNIDSTITIRQLLNMKSGIDDYQGTQGFINASYNGNPTRYWTPEEILSWIGPMNFPPGSQLVYCNTNYILLGMIIKVATGSTMSTEFRNQLLNPLQLNNTYFAGEETLLGTIAQPWSDHTGTTSLVDYSFLYNTATFSLGWTVGAMYSTAEDLARWGKALFGGSVLTAAYQDQMLTFTDISSTLWPSEWIGYGLGAWQYEILLAKSSGEGLALIPVISPLLLISLWIVLLSQ